MNIRGANVLGALACGGLMAYALYAQHVLKGDHRLVEAARLDLLGLADAVNLDHVPDEHAHALECAGAPVVDDEAPVLIADR